MMRWFYSAGIFCYQGLVRVAALFNPKAALWVEGRKGWAKALARAVEPAISAGRPVVWFHVSSLGEFEQGRPVLEAIREQWPDRFILLTFFSPSGYEVRKRYDRADHVCYLPADTPGNARRFLSIVRPSGVFFVKYDFWFNFMRELSARKIPLYVLSALFTQDQHFFQWYGAWQRARLRSVSHFFVQDEESAAVLARAGIQQVTVTGDTRFDRVAGIAQHATTMPLLEKFRNGRDVFIAGSCWEQDEEVFLPFIEQNRHELRYILAPHEVTPDNVSRIRSRLPRPSILLSQLSDDNALTADTLIVDSVGHLASLYRYATIAFIGGGFGKGIHNIQEPVTFGVPVFFGPKFGRFREARDLVRLGGAIPVDGRDGFLAKAGELFADPEEITRRSVICRSYVASQTGATRKIIDYLALKA